VHRAIERPLPVFEVEKDPDPRLDDLLHDPGDIDLLAPEARFLAHDQDLERRPRRERAQEPGQTGALDELCPAHPVIDDDVLLGNLPALLGGIGLGALDLPGHRFLLVTDPTLIGRFPGVDRRRNHETSPFRRLARTSAIRTLATASTTAATVAWGQNAEG